MLRNISRCFGALVWNAANGGLSYGGLSQFKDIRGKGLFPPFSGFPPCCPGAPAKGEKADFG